MKYERKLKKVGNGSLGLMIPPDVAKFLEFDFDMDVIINVEEGKHGKFLAIWRKEEDKDNNLNKIDNN